MPSESHPLALPHADASHDPIVARVPFFYGWVMLPIAVLGQIATSPGQTYGISVFIDSIGRDLQLSDRQISGAYMLGTLLAALPVAFVGGWMDRYGIRRAMTVVVLLFGATCMATSQISGLATLFLAFLMLRMLGQGALSLLSSNTVAMWFHARLGTASGLMCIGSAGAFAVLPPLNLHLIEQFGWRGAYVLLGCAVWAVMLPVLAVFYRNRPEDIGQLPDSAKQITDEDTTDKLAQELHWSMTLPEAARTRAYWLMLVMSVVWSLVGTAIVFNIVGLFESSGLSKSDVPLFFTHFAVAMAAAQLLGGMLADRMRLNFLLAASVAGMTASVAYLTQIDSLLSARLFAVALGASQGLFIVLGQTIWPRYFGRAHLGKIRGTIWTACVAGSASGPFILNVARDLSGSYAAALWIFAAVYALLAALAPLVTPPRQRQATA